MNVLIVLASLSHGASRKMTEIGLALGMLGALGLAVGNLRGSRVPGAALVGGLLLAAGLALVLIVVHWGITPYFGKR
jgi:hypothetical protein